MGRFTDFFKRSMFPSSSEEGVALQIPMYWTTETDPHVKACVDKITNTLSSIPMQLYSHTRNGKKLAVFDPIFRVIEHPNADDTPTIFYSTLYRHILLDGNAYVYLSRDASGNIVAFTLCDPSKVSISRESSGAKIFNIENRTYTERNILHIPYNGTGYNGTKGVSPCEMMRDTINLHVALLSYIRTYFDNSLGQKQYIELGQSYNGKSMAEAYGKLIPMISKYVTGHKNAGKVMIAPPDTKMSSINQPSNAEAELHSLLKLVEADIARGFNIPPECIDSSQQKYGSLEQQQGLFLSSTIQPLGNHICESFEKLLNPTDTNLYISYEYKMLLTTNTKDTIDFLVKEVQSGLMSVNEARKKLGMTDIGSAGDYYWIPGNLIPQTEETIAAVMAKQKSVMASTQHNPNGDDKS